MTSPHKPPVSRELQATMDEQFMTCALPRTITPERRRDIVEAATWAGYAAKNLLQLEQGLCVDLVASVVTKATTHDGDTFMIAAKLLSQAQRELARMFYEELRMMPGVTATFKRLDECGGGK